MNEKTCYQCRYFNSEREFLEKEFPGVLSLSSFLGSTTKGNGLCTKRDVFLPGRSRMCQVFFILKR